jgi:hypothetical protein
MNFFFMKKKNLLFFFVYTDLLKKKIVITFLNKIGIIMYVKIYNIKNNNNNNNKQYLSQQMRGGFNYSFKKKLYSNQRVTKSHGIWWSMGMEPRPYKYRKEKILEIKIKMNLQAKRYTNTYHALAKSQA